MKLNKLSLKNFKRIGELELDFTHEVTGVAEDLVLLQGANGSGKTSVLQAITAMLAVATGRIQQLSDLYWPGFDFDLVSDAWPAPAEIELEVAFSEEELCKTREYWERLRIHEPSLTVTPGMERCVSLRRVGDKAMAPTQELLFQFRGRDYARRLWKYERSLLDPFPYVGGMFWYDVYREPLSTLKRPSRQNDDEQLGAFDEQSLRDKLVDIFSFHQLHQDNPQKRSYFRELDQVYRRIFPQRRLEGMDIDPRPGMAKLFYFHDGDHRYELRELSGGERAIIPILFDFINLNIHKSIILIDEMELHLNPTLHQSFLRATKALGKDNQFIFTSHSDMIDALMRPKKTINLDSVK